MQISSYGHPQKDRLPQHHLHKYTSSSHPSFGASVYLLAAVEARTTLELSSFGFLHNEVRAMIH